MENFYPLFRRTGETEALYYTAAVGAKFTYRKYQERKIPDKIFFDTMSNLAIWTEN
ncbi:acyltransferase domain-containing protein [Blautia sp. ICN-22010]|uniref:acyltransferase domain-containing protein n=1 Tax=Blautia sp. ICN-22010 TaxID=3134653 RepID=UPI0040403C4E